MAKKYKHLKLAFIEASEVPDSNPKVYRVNTKGYGAYLPYILVEDSNDWLLVESETMKATTEKDEAFCLNCDMDTPHVIHEDGHERDSSGCWSICLVCGERASGMTSNRTTIDEEDLEYYRKQYNYKP